MELTDDYVWDMQIRQALPQDASLPANEDAQSGVLEQIWSDVARPYWADQEVWQWRGVGGPAPRRVMLALDADYAARKAGAVTAALLAANPLAALQSSAAPPLTASPTDYSLFLAHNWIDHLQTFVLASEAQSVATDRQGSFLRQPREALAFIAACRPLIPAGFFAPPEGIVSAKPPFIPLRADELEALSQAFVRRDIFPGPSNDQDKADAVALLKAIERQQPDYPELTRAKSLLMILDPPRAVPSPPAQ